MQFIIFIIFQHENTILWCQYMGLMLLSTCLILIEGLFLTISQKKSYLVHGAKAAFSQLFRNWKIFCGCNNRIGRKAMHLCVIRCQCILVAFHEWYITIFRTVRQFSVFILCCNCFAEPQKSVSPMMAHLLLRNLKISTLSSSYFSNYFSI